MRITSNQDNMNFTGIIIPKKPTEKSFSFEVFYDEFTKGIIYKDGAVEKTNPTSKIADALAGLHHSGSLIMRTLDIDYFAQKAKDVVTDSPMTKAEKELALNLINQINKAREMPEIRRAEMQVTENGKTTTVRGLGFDYQM